MIISRKSILSFIFLTIFGLALVSIAGPASADTSLVDSQVGITEIGSAYGNNNFDIRFIIARIIVVILGFLGVIFLGLTIFAGFRYMTAAGNEEQTKKALSQIKDSVIGLIIVLASWAIVTYVLRALNWSVRGLYF